MKWRRRAALYGDLQAPSFMLKSTVLHSTPGRTDSANQIASKLGARSNGLSGAQTDYKSITSANILGLRVSAEGVKVDGRVSISATPLDETSAGTTGFAGFDRSMGLD
jgi:hypothetical protein